MRNRSSRGGALSSVLVMFALVGLACSATGPTPSADGAAPSVPLAAADSASGVEENLNARAIIERWQQTLTKLMVGAKELSPQGRYDVLLPAVRATFDIPGMARLTLGDIWRDLPEVERRSWVQIFRRFHVWAAVRKYGSYKGQQFRILGEQDLPGGLILIKSQLDYPGRGVDIFMDHRLRMTSVGWRVIDIHQPTSISEVGMRREEYASVYSRKGYDGLIEMMEKKIAKYERE